MKKFFITLFLGLACVLSLHADNALRFDPFTGKIVQDVKVGTGRSLIFLNGGTMSWDTNSVFAGDKAAFRAAIGVPNSTFDGYYSTLLNKPTLGTGAAYNVPALVGSNAAPTEVVRGDDPRLNDKRLPPDTAVIAGTYGDATHIPTVVIGADGRVTSATQTLVTTGAGDLFSSASSSTDGQGVEYNLTTGKVVRPSTRTGLIFENAGVRGTATVNAPIQFSGGTLFIAAATNSVNGYLSSTDWITFNGKQPAGNYITGITGDIVATGPGSVIGTIQPGAVTLAKMANMATASLIYRRTAGTGAPEVNTLAQLKSDLALVKADVGLGSVDNTADSAKPVSTAQQTALNLKADLRSVAALSSNAIALGAAPFNVKEATWSSATSNKTLTFTGVAAGAGVVVDFNFTDATAPIFPAARRNGASSTITTYTYPAGHYRLAFTVRADGSSIDLNDDYATAADLPVAATPTNYTPASPNVESHLAAIDAKFGTLGAGSNGNAFSSTVTQASHGFVAGDVVYNNAGTYAKAKADAFSTIATPYFVQSVTTNTFVAVPAGRADITGLGYTAGTYRFLSDATAGTTSATAPTAVGSFTAPVMYVESTTVGYVNPPYPLSNANGISVKTTTYTATKADSAIICNSASPFTITLYNATTAGGQPLIINNKNTGTVTIDATSLGQINGSNTITLSQYQSVTLVPDGTNWTVN